MKILITTPSFRVHGGIRVLIEWANHLSRRGHEVTLQCFTGSMAKNWITIDEKVMIRYGQKIYDAGYGVIVAGTPPIASLLQRTPAKAKKFALLQMAEDMFQPDNSGYVQQMQAGYTVDFPIIGISKWVEQHVRQFRGDKPMYYIGNGVTENFKPGKKAQRLTILAEGWNGYNHAKDQKEITARTCRYLKQKYNAKIVVFDQQPIKHNQDVPDEYHVIPSPEKIVELYQRATIMVKATRYDARSCSPVEAMSCGTITARGLIKGDDDLIHEENCLRGGYDLGEMIHLAERLIENENLRVKLEKNGLEYRKKYLSWDYWMSEVEKIFADDDRVLVSHTGKERISG